MGISRSLPIPTTTPVLPGTAVQQSIYTNAGFTAGDYVYRYSGNSVGSYPYFTSAPPGVTITTVIAGKRYSFPYGTGATFNRSSMTTPTTIPSTYSVTFPAATSMGTTYLAQQNVATNIPTYGPRCALLTNGNVVVLYWSAGGNLSYRIYNTSGTAVFSGDVATGISLTGWTTTREGAYGVCALNAGGFAVAYTASSQAFIVTFSSTGTVLLTSGALTPTGLTIGAICADADDTLYTIGAVSTSATNCHMAKYTSALTVALNSASLGTNYNCAPKIVATLSGHLMTSFDSSSTNTYALFTNTFVSLTSISAGKSANSAVSVCASLEDNGGGFTASIISGTGTVLLAYLAALPTVTATNTTTFISDTTTGTSGVCAIFPAYVTTAGVYDGSSNSVIAVYTGSASTVIRTKIANLASNRSTWTFGSSSFVAPFTNSSTAQYTGATVVCATGTASAFIAGFENTSNYSSISMSGTFTYTTPSTQTVPATLYPTPANGYSLIGVATNTAAAGSYGNVVLNGVVSLSSSYGTSTTVSGFNYNPTNSYGFQGNLGYVVSRVVTLQGLE